ncbi:hypothetical protein BDV93DRAFT_507978 [Ceratobasidium sp. AG-I]|nr:hypothetical protein BDV93DRAFT_507978 [Ceratobasidium sp. AG-I]
MIGCPPLKSLYGFVKNTGEHSDEETGEGSDMHYEDDGDQAQAEPMEEGGGQRQYLGSHHQPLNSYRGEGHPPNRVSRPTGGVISLKTPSYNISDSTRNGAASSPSAGDADGALVVFGASSAISSCQVAESSVVISGIVGALSSNTSERTSLPELEVEMHELRSPQEDFTGDEETNELNSSKVNPAFPVISATVQVNGRHAFLNTTTTCAPDAKTSHTWTTQARHLCNLLLPRCFIRRDDYEGQNFWPHPHSFYYRTIRP